LLDVGCGEGKVTAELAAALPHGWVTGIDSSAEMIDYARRHFGPPHHPHLEFLQMDARAIQLPMTYDVVFSNAALHWVDGHRAFLRGAATALRPGGRLLVSCGGRGNAEGVLRATRAVMRDPRWRDAFRGMRKPYFFHRPDPYADWLKKAGFQATAARLVPKEMLLAHRTAFVGWVRTTWIPYTQRLPEPLREEFVHAVVDRYLARHPVDAAGRVRVGMVRLEVDALLRAGT